MVRRRRFVARIKAGLGSGGFVFGEERIYMYLYERRGTDCYEVTCPTIEADSREQGVESRNRGVQTIHECGRRHKTGDLTWVVQAFRKSRSKLHVSNKMPGTMA